MGDPTGVGPEVLLKVLSSISTPSSISVVGDLGWLKVLSRRLKLSIPWKRFHWIDRANLPPSLRLGMIQPEAGRAAYEYLSQAAELLKRKEADCLVTCPVSKEAIVRAGIPWVGHTEYLGKRFSSRPVMMFVTGKFRVSLATTHVSLKDLPSVITRERLIRTIELTREALLSDFGVFKPRIGLAALNPHAGEGGLFGQEESKLLRPVVDSLGDSVDGPLPADSLIREAALGRYDAVIALYHDQALIPVKLMGWEEAVNVTLGLPFIRTSPVHGTAFEIAGKGKADPRSLKTAIQLGLQLTRHRQKRRT